WRFSCWIVCRYVKCRMPLVFCVAEWVVPRQLYCCRKSNRFYYVIFHRRIFRSPLPVAQIECGSRQTARLVYDAGIAASCPKYLGSSSGNEQADSETLSRSKNLSSLFR